MIGLLEDRRTHFCQISIRDHSAFSRLTRKKPATYNVGHLTIELHIPALRLGVPKDLIRVCLHSPKAPGGGPSVRLQKAQGKA